MTDTEEREKEQKDNIEHFCYQIMIAINEIKEILKEQKNKNVRAKKEDKQLKMDF
jgi:hypothetical protein